jgi:hypothetical protein
MLTGRVEVDEFYVGGPEEGLAGRLNLEKALVVVAAQEDGVGIGRIRLHQIVDASAQSLAWKDPATGLMWATDTNWETGMNWSHASNYCSSLRVAKYSSWRLPTIGELEGIYDQSQNVYGRHIKGGIMFHYSNGWYAWSNSTGTASGEGLGASASPRGSGPPAADVRTSP